MKADEIELLSDRFKLSHEQIDEAVTEAKLGALRDRAANSEDSFEVSIDRLRRAARERSGHELATLSRKIYPRYGWDDIVLPPDVIKQLHEVCDRVAWRRRVLDEWGFDAKLSAGKGVNALFAGPSGTGKTMAAEIIARELALDLYKIDLSSIVSKYIGDTERNLDRVFRAAEGASVILFFDEAMLYSASDLKYTTRTIDMPTSKSLSSSRRWRSMTESRSWLPICGRTLMSPFCAGSLSPYISISRQLSPVADLGGRMAKARSACRRPCARGPL